MKRTRAYWNRRTAKKWRIAGLLIILAFLATRYLLAVSVQNVNARTAQERFNATIQNDVTNLNNRFEVYADTLYSARALWLTDKTVSRQDWFTFFNAQNIKQRYPAVYGLGYVKIINNGQNADLTYLAPESADQSVIGYDLYSSQARSQMLLEARDTGVPRASVPIALASGTTDVPSSLLIAMPIYNTASATSNVDERRAALDGFTVLAVQYPQLLNSIFKVNQAYGPVSLSATTNKEVVYHAGAPLKHPGLKKVVEVNLAGQPWQFNFSAPSDYELSNTMRLAPEVLLWSIVPFAIILLSAFYFAINYLVLRRHYLQNNNGDDKK